MVSRGSCQQPEVVISSKDSESGSFHPISRRRYGSKGRGSQKENGACEQDGLMGGSD